MTLRDMVVKLSRDELIELIDRRCLLWQVTKTDIVLAKIACLERQAKKAFTDWSTFKMPEVSAVRRSYFYQKVEEKEKIWQKYDRISKRISRLFDSIDRTRSKNATDKS
ncbi:MAG: hypothetical protein VR65_19920 [Desulfobulbaceae bacterium BRH_c16a]|nr:MAG: hypothetical protein VR65_19920 [Desulfobulbaceae bacterium BRH_c16a]